MAIPGTQRIRYTVFIGVAVGAIVAWLTYERSWFAFLVGSILLLIAGSWGTWRACRANALPVVPLGIRVNLMLLAAQAFTLLLPTQTLGLLLAILLGIFTTLLLSALELVPAPAGTTPDATHDTIPTSPPIATAPVTRVLPYGLLEAMQLLTFFFVASLVTAAPLIILHPVPPFFWSALVGIIATVLLVPMVRPFRSFLALVGGMLIVEMSWSLSLLPLSFWVQAALLVLLFFMVGGLQRLKTPQQLIIASILLIVLVCIIALSAWYSF